MHIVLKIKMISKYGIASFFKVIIKGMLPQRYKHWLAKTAREISTAAQR